MSGQSYSTRRQGQNITVASSTGLRRGRSTQRSRSYSSTSKYPINFLLGPFVQARALAICAICFLRLMGSSLHHERMAISILDGHYVLGMMFLPGTFVSVGSPFLSSSSKTYPLTSTLKAIFSMSFCDCATERDEESGRWALSGKFWLYWVVALPLTAFTLTLWYAWQRDRARREERSQV